MIRAVAERHVEQERLIGEARTYIERLVRRMPVVAAGVAGSVARGDFNLWSDVDVVVVAENLPRRVPDRLELLWRDKLGAVQPVGFTPDELRTERVRRNPLVRELAERGIILLGEPRLRELLARR